MKKSKKNGDRKLMFYNTLIKVFHFFGLSLLAKLYLIWDTIIYNLCNFCDIIVWHEDKHNESYRAPKCV